MTGADLQEAKVTLDIDPAQDPQALDHETLKYHLLGPSLTKAGQDTVDQQKVSEIIYNASKGSRFFNNEEVKDRNLTEKIARILARKAQLEKLDLSSDLRKADEYIEELEMTRDITQHVVHIDCDAFYAAVEELDRPELKDVPMAVGQGVLTTCNYHARKFGCRSGMAGFVAKKLCPQLISLPLNFEKYTAKAMEVRQILAEYDPTFESASIDEAYMNITPYCEKHEREPADVVSEMRALVAERCLITISAGIAANAKLAKVCSNKNKPNGQFQLPNDRPAILSFMRDLPTRKVNGIGRVFERELKAIGIETCGDIYAHRAMLARLFGEKAFQFLMTCYLGLGRTDIRPATEHERKSVGTESTFRDMSGRDDLRKQLQWTADELEKDLARTQFKGRTLVLKIKLHSYEVFTRQTIPPKAVYKAADLYRFSEPMLSKLEREIPGLTLRLMGLRVTNLVSTKKDGIDFFGMNRPGGLSASAPATKILGASHDNSDSKQPATDDEGWEIWPEAEFEEAARQERQDEFNAVLQLSQEHAALASDRPQDPNPIENDQINPDEDLDTSPWKRARTHTGFRWRAYEEEAQQGPGQDQQHSNSASPAGSVTTTPSRRHGREIVPNPIPLSQLEAGAEATAPQEVEAWRCPVCARPQVADDRAFNEHIDLCLSRGTIEDAVRSAETRDAEGVESGSEKRAVEAAKSAKPSGFALGGSSVNGVGKGGTAGVVQKKRGRTPKETSGNVQKKLFFG